MRLYLAAAFTAAGLACAGASQARPFTVDDLLNQESFGAVSIDPTGRWLVYERRGAYASAPRFDLDQDTPKTTARLQVVDLTRPSMPRPLAPDLPAGQLLGAFSPDGARLAALMFRDGGLRLEVITLANGTRRSFDITPETGRPGRALQWLSDRELLVIAAADALPSRMRLGHLSAAELPSRWRATGDGRLAVTAVGSGAELGVRRRPPARRLLRVDVETGAHVELARGEFVDLEVSPDRRRVALRRTDADLQPAPDRPVQGDWGIGLQAERLSLLDLERGELSDPCGTCDVLPAPLSWSPSGDRLLLYVRDPDAGWSDGRLVVVAAATGALNPVAADLRPVLDYRPERLGAAWMGDMPLVFARPAANREARADWWRLSPDGPVNLTRALAEAPRRLSAVTPESLVAIVQGQAWRIDPTGRTGALAAGAVHEALRGPSGRDGRLTDQPPPVATVLETRRGLRRLKPFTADTRSFAALPAQGVVAAIGPDAAVAVVRSVDANGVERLALQRRGASAIPLDVLNRGWSDLDPIEVRRVDHIGPEGQALTSWLFLPPRAPGTPPPPLLVRAYSGDIYRTAPTPWPPILGLVGDPRALAAHGYAVLTPSLPVPRAAPREPVSGLADRVLAIVDAAARAPATAGAFDPERLAIWGHSYGGYTALAVISQTSRFKAAVAENGFYDLVAQWSGLSAPHRALQEDGVRSNAAAGHIEDAQGRMGGPPWQDPARFARNSPLLQADRIETPVLLVHGDQDSVIGLHQAEAMFSALYRQGKDAILLTYWGEGHFISSPENVRDLYARTFEFLDRHLAAPPKSAVPTPTASTPP